MRRHETSNERRLNHYDFSLRSLEPALFPILFFSALTAGLTMAALTDRAYNQMLLHAGDPFFSARILSWFLGRRREVQLIVTKERKVKQVAPSLFALAPVSRFITGYHYSAEIFNYMISAIISAVST